MQSNSHDFFFFGSQVFFNQRNMLIRNILHLFFCVFCEVFT